MTIWYLSSAACEKDALRTIRKQLEADLASDAEVSLLGRNGFRL